MANDRLKFPLEDQDWYEGKISFQVRIEQPPSIEIYSADKTDGNQENISEDKFEELTRSFTNMLGGKQLKSTSASTQPQLGQKCSLYLPRAIQINEGVTYDGADLGRIGATTEAAMNSGANFGSQLGKSYTEPTAALAEMFKNNANEDVARLATYRAAQTFGKREFSDGVKSSLKVATNPNTRQLFKQVNIRDFAFTFKLIPTSQSEAEMTKNIVQFFREELYPEEFAVKLESGVQIPIGYKFPNTFDIKFKHKDKNIVHRILPCYLVTMSTNYNPTGAGFFEDGNFSEIEMTLNFRESRTLTKQLVRDGGY